MARTCSAPVLRPPPRLHRLEPREVPAIFIVTNLGDSQGGTLRSVIASANATSELDTIKFQDGLTGTIWLSSEIQITQPLEIFGPGASIIKISCSSGPAIFTDYSNMIHLSISGVAVTGCVSNKRPGGAISMYNASLTLSHCVISNNRSTASAAGGIYCRGVLTATDTAFVNNRATNYFQTAGAFLSQGAILTRCTITGNTAYRAGGMSVWNSLEMTDCVVANNFATGDLAGGVHFSGPFSTAVIRNCTISNNKAPNGYGGGIGLGGLAGFKGTLFIQNSTITENTSGVAGGGIGRESGTGIVVLESSIVANNRDDSELSSHDVFLFGAVSAHASAVGTATGIKDFSPDAITIGLMGTDLKLAPLADNGGPTMTHALLPESPCINAGSNPASLLSDQRGQGFPRINGKAADIGAYEYQGWPPTVVSVQVNDGSSQRSRVTSLTVRFDRELPLPVNPESAFTLRRQSDNAAIALAAAVAGESVVLTFAGGQLDFGSLADGRYALTAIAAKINGGTFDGNGDGIIGDDFLFNFHRLFGDIDGDAEVDANDFAAFRIAFGEGTSPFDFDNDGDVDVGDFGAFRARFGTAI